MKNLKMQDFIKLDICLFVFNVLLHNTPTWYWNKNNFYFMVRKNSQISKVKVFVWSLIMHTLFWIILRGHSQTLSYLTQALERCCYLGGGEGGIMASLHFFKAFRLPKAQNWTFANFLNLDQPEKPFKQF